MTASSGGFELRGDDGVETRLLVHSQLGYAIAIPGRPRIVAPTAESPRYDVVIALGDAPIEIGFRMDEVPTEITPDKLVPALLASYAQLRADDPASLQTSWIQGKMLARGAATGMRVNYQLRGDDPAAMEFLAITVKGGRGVVYALHMTVRYRKGETSPFAWANLRGALGGHQSWNPGVLPSTKIWPESSVFAPLSVKFELTDAALREAQAKAEAIGTLMPEQVDRLATYLLAVASSDFPPATSWAEDLIENIARNLAAFVPAEVAAILLRDADQIRSVHDYRGWLWECYWAVGNRSELRTLN